MDDRPTPPDDATTGPAAAAPPTQYSRPRRTPRFGVFVASGVVAGLVAAVGLTVAGSPQGQASYGAVLGYLSVSLGVVGALLGGALAALLDVVTGRRRRRRGRSGARGTLSR